MVVMARLYNDNEHIYENKIPGLGIVKIPGRGFIECPFDDATKIKCTFYPAKFDGGGKQLPETYSKLRVVIYDHTQVTEPVLYTCHATGKTFTSEREYLQHLKSDEALVEAQRLANEDENNVPENIRTKKRTGPA